MPMSDPAPTLLNEIRSLKYAIILSACLLAFVISISSMRDGGGIGAFLSVIIGITAAVTAARTKYKRR